MIRPALIGAYVDVTQKRRCVLAGVSRTTVYVKRKTVVFVEPGLRLSLQYKKQKPGQRRPAARSGVQLKLPSSLS
jgi:hypothetical protein